MMTISTSELERAIGMEEKAKAAVEAATELKGAGCDGIPDDHREIAEVLGRGHEFPRWL